MDDGFLWPPRLTMDAVYGRLSASVLHWRRIVVIWSVQNAIAHAAEGAPARAAALGQGVRGGAPRRYPHARRTPS